MSYSWINKLNESDGRLHKEDVIRQAHSAATLGSEDAIRFLTLAKLTYNPFVTFGVKKINDTVGITQAENPWDEFQTLLTDLQNRTLTGNAARDAIDAISQRFDSDEWNGFCAPVIRRDLRAGVSTSTLNKLGKKTVYEVPLFECQLATNCEGRPEMSGKKRLERKLDGVRMIAVVEFMRSGPTAPYVPVVNCFSRNGKQFENFGVIEAQIAKNALMMRQKFGSNHLNGFVLDGEVMGQSFQDLMTQTRRKKNAAADDSVYYVFDLMPLDDFRRGFWNMQQRRRMEILDKIASSMVDAPNVQTLPHLDVDLDTAVGREALDKFSAQCVEEGFEGIMIKDLEAPYTCKRSTFWMKWKPLYSYDLEVVAVEEGTGKNAGRLGALVCRGIDGASAKYIEVNVGSGYTDEFRQAVWADPSIAIGRIAEILADAITQNRDGSYSLRFPRFNQFRDDK